MRLINRNDCATDSATSPSPGAQMTGGAATKGGQKPGMPGDSLLPEVERFEFGVKGGRQIDALLELLGPLHDEHCICLTHGTASAAIHASLRLAGGHWLWAELDAGGVTEQQQLGDPIVRIRPEQLPFADATFDRAVMVDANVSEARLHELSAELMRILRPHGVAIVHVSTAAARPVAALRAWLRGAGEALNGAGVGHAVDRLERSLADAGLNPLVRVDYGGTFTELAELGFELAARSVPPTTEPNGGRHGANDSRTLRKRIPRLAYPILRAVSALDSLAPRRAGYAAAIGAMKPE
jgi:hypothetical protein